jgi:sec-independent protein translocase protein TatA
MNIGPTELLIVLAIVLLLFGSAKLPKLARSLGEAQKEFKKGVDEGKADDGKAADSKAADTKAADGDADKA